MIIKFIIINILCRRQNLSSHAVFTKKAGLGP